MKKGDVSHSLVRVIYGIEIIIGMAIRLKSFNNKCYKRSYVYDRPLCCDTGRTHPVTATYNVLQPLWVPLLPLSVSPSKPDFPVLSRVLSPSKLDLLICPCTVALVMSRLGVAGFYLSLPLASYLSTIPCIAYIERCIH